MQALGIGCIGWEGWRRRHGTTTIYSLGHMGLYGRGSVVYVVCVVHGENQSDSIQVVHVLL